MAKESIEKMIKSTLSKDPITRFIQYRSIPDQYAERLVDANLFTQEDIKNIVESHGTWLNETLKQSMTDAPQQTSMPFAGRWNGMKQAESNITLWDTGVELNLLDFVGKKSVQVPSNFVRMDKLFWNAF